MSTKVLDIANTELSLLKNKKTIHFDWRVRQEIYEILNRGSTSIPSKQHQSLAIQSAEFVIPLFTLVNDEDKFAYTLLENAKKVFENQTFNTKELDDIQDTGYHMAQWFGFNYETKQRNFQSTYIGGTTYKVLIEVRYLRNPWKSINSLSDLTDNDLFTKGDTAAMASFAYSVDITTDEYQPKLIYQFWEWWVKDALPKALKYKKIE